MYKRQQQEYIIGFRPEVKTGLFADKVDGYDSVTFIDTVKESVYTLVYYVKSVVVGFVRLFTLRPVSYTHLVAVLVYRIIKRMTSQALTLRI